MQQTTGANGRVAREDAGLAASLRETRGGQDCCRRQVWVLGIARVKGEGLAKTAVASNTHLAQPSRAEASRAGACFFVVFLCFFFLLPSHLMWIGIKKKATNGVSVVGVDADKDSTHSLFEHGWHRKNERRCVPYVCILFLLCRLFRTGPRLFCYCCLLLHALCG